MTWIRVKDKITGHHYTTAVVLPQHEVLDQPAVDANGKPLPPKHNINKPKAKADGATKADAADTKEK